MQMYLVPAVATVVALILGAVFTGLLIPFLEKKQFRQFVREEGPQSHLSKTGTPSMGGFAIVGATVISTIGISLAYDRFDIRVAGVLIVMVLFAIIGFIDDYEKAIKKNNAGISPKQKIVLQLGFSIAFAVFAAYFSYGSHGMVSGTEVWIPIWDKFIDLGWLYIPFEIFVLVAFSNAVNLTDGLDGLASGVTALVAFFMLIGGVAFGYANIPVVFGAVAGGCLGFLMYNKNPAKIFMGDTGSMALGGVLAGGAIMMKMEFLVAIAGLIYVLEALSVIIQVAYFKKTRKRIFKMAPIHHHFELCGMSERKVVAMFWAATLVFCLLAIAVMNI